MAVSTVTKYAVTGGIDEAGHRTWRVVYKVVTDTITDDPFSFADHPLLPRIGDFYTGSFVPATSQSYSGDPGAWCQGMTYDYWDRDPTAKMWAVTATFSTKPQPCPDFDLSTDPTNWPWRFNGSFVNTLVPITTDRFGQPVTNEAGDLFTDATRPEAHQTLVMSRVHTSFYPNVIESYVNGLNDRTFFGLSARKWRFNGAQYSSICVGRETFYDVTYSFESHPKGWDFQPANIGPRYWDTNGNKVSFRDDHGREYGDGLGALEIHASKQAGARSATASPIVIYYDGQNGLDPFEIEGQYDFASVLSIPSTLPS